MYEPTKWNSLHFFLNNYIFATPLFQKSYRYRGAIGETIYRSLINNGN